MRNGLHCDKYNEIRLVCTMEDCVGMREKKFNSWIGLKTDHKESDNNLDIDEAVVDDKEDSWTDNSPAPNLVLPAPHCLCLTDQDSIRPIKQMSLLLLTILHVNVTIIRILGMENAADKITKFGTDQDDADLHGVDGGGRKNEYCGHRSGHSGQADGKVSGESDEDCVVQMGGHNGE